MKHYRRFVTHATILGIVFATMYGLVGLQNRYQANDMPELLATQAAKQLDAGLGLQSINMGATDLADNPVPFVVVYDKNGKAVAGSGYLDKKLAVLPAGVAQHATSGKPHAVTWAPRDGLRIASVTVESKNYYVTGGQSLAAIESRATRLLWLVLAGYVLSLLVLLLVLWQQSIINRRSRCDCGCCTTGPHSSGASTVAIDSKKKTGAQKAAVGVKDKQPSSRGK